jgi:hypothetical protein
MRRESAVRVTHGTDQQAWRFAGWRALRASERTTAIAKLNRQRHLTPSCGAFALARREQWARYGRSSESLASRPGIREQNLPQADMAVVATRYRFEGFRASCAARNA